MAKLWSQEIVSNNIPRFAINSPGTEILLGTYRNSIQNHAILYGLSGSSPIWEVEIDFRVATAALSDTAAIIGGTDGMFAIFDPSTGEVRYEQKTSATMITSAKMSASGGTAGFLGENGEYFLFRFIEPFGPSNDAEGTGYENFYDAFLLRDNLPALGITLGVGLLVGLLLGRRRSK